MLKRYLLPALMLLTIVFQAKAALLKWSSIEAHPAAELYLLAMLFQPLGL